MEWELPFPSYGDETYSLPTTNRAASDSDSDDEKKLAKRLKEKSRNRENARESRQRKKERVRLMEIQVTELTAEVERLKMVAKQATPCFPDQTFTGSIRFLHEKLAAALSNPLTSDQEFNDILQEMEDKLGINGETRIQTLSKTFEMAVEMMIPVHVKLCMWLSEADGSVKQPGPAKWEEFVRALNLSNEAVTVCQGDAYHQQKLAMRDDFEGVKKTLGKIKRNSQVLTSLVRGFRQLVRPRQAAYFTFWVFKTYSNLDVDKVLNYGCNSADFLSSE